MFKICKVKRVGYSNLYNCVVAFYEEDGLDKCAACTENLSIKCGDMIEIYTDDYVNYKGFRAMALKIAYQ